jgi:hypothetical protein
MSATTLPLQERPPRDPRFQPYLDTKATYGALYAMVGIRYAGNEPNPRPLPQTTLYDFKRQCAQPHPGRHPLTKRVQKESLHVWYSTE